MGIQAKLAGGVAILAWGMVLLTCVGCGVPLDVTIRLAAGPVLFLNRVLPLISVNWSGLATAVVCLALLAVGMHRFLAWLRAQWPPHAEKALQPWRPRWTGALLGLVVLMFVAGISAVGIAHQSAWLVTSPEPLTHGGLHGAAMKMTTSNRLKEIGLALHNYHEHNGHFPAGGTFDPLGRGLHGWQTYLLPYVELEAIYRSIDLQRSWDDPVNVTHFHRIVKDFLSPLETERRDASDMGLSHFAANGWLLGGDQPRSFKDITDGTATTLLAGEAGGNFKPWGNPTNWRDPALGLNRHPNGFGSRNRDGVLFVFADGSVRPIAKDVHPSVLRALSTPSGGEKVPEDF